MARRSPAPPAATVCPEDQGGWYIPSTIHQLPDGSTLVKPGRAVRRGTAAQVARWTGVGRRSLARLAEAGLISRAQPSPGLYLYYPAEVEALIERTAADPSYWSRVKSTAHLTGPNLRSS